VGHKKDRSSATLAAGYSRENVLHYSGSGIACANASRMLDLRIEAQDAELRDETTPLGSHRDHQRREASREGKVWYLTIL
jgi:hypothetical protein